MKYLRLFLRLSRPFFILSAVLLYFTGIGISHYLSGPVNWTNFFLGLVWIIFISLGSQYLNEYFDPPCITSIDQHEIYALLGG